MISPAAFATKPTLVTPPRLRAITNSRGYDYLVSRPQDSRSPQRRWPLILFLHGAAERGAQVEDVARQGLPRLLADSPDLSAAEVTIAADIAGGFIVVAPQCAHYEVWDEAALLALLDDVGGDSSVDARRVYLTGMSMGGFGVWSLGLRHPERFAALVPICGGGRVRDVTAAASNRGPALRSLGVWAFHGARDRVVPVEESERMIDALKRAGAPDIRLTIYPDIEHDAWTPSYGNPDLYTWLLRHQR